MVKETKRRNDETKRREVKKLHRTAEIRKKKHKITKGETSKR